MELGLALRHQDAGSTLFHASVCLLLIALQMEKMVCFDKEDLKGGEESIAFSGICWREDVVLEKRLGTNANDITLILSLRCKLLKV